MTSNIGQPTDAVGRETDIGEAHDPFYGERRAFAAAFHDEADERDAADGELDAALKTFTGSGVEFFDEKGVLELAVANINAGDDWPTALRKAHAKWEKDTLSPEAVRKGVGGDIRVKSGKHIPGEADKSGALAYLKELNRRRDAYRVRRDAEKADPRTTKGARAKTREILERLAKEK